ncbi:MAG: transglycosylase SLT domain-containing protein [Pseudomonadota bacterium]
MRRGLRLALAALAVLLLAGCAGAPPRNVENICAIFEEKQGWFMEDWFDEAEEAEEHWRIPIPVMMATLYQESKFQAKAKPPRKRILWIIPWKRPSSAYGYAQVLDETWDVYVSDTGNSFANRKDFGDSIDFVGWYHDRSAKKLGIARGDARNLYLAYHEGHGGYSRGTWKNKKWLIDVAAKVDGRSKTWAGQLAKCRDGLDGWF